MDGSLLIGTHLSSLFPQSRALSIYVQTQRANTPLSSIQRESDPAEHALYSSVLQTSSTGTILLRVLHGGLIVELVSLATQNQPLRFVFPSAVLLAPGIFLWENDEIHFIAVTITGSIYRAVIPTGGGLELWHNRTQNIWISEYLIKNFSGTMKGLVHIHSTHCVFIGLPNGSLMRLETEYAGSGRLDDEWTESIFQAGSFLSSFKSFLPSLSSANSDAGEIISLATHPWPTDVGYVWTLSRDRVLRLWKPKIGCVVAKTLSQGFGRESSTVQARPSPGKPHVLLDPARQILLRVFSFAEDYDHFYVLAFLPAIPSSTFGGSFQLLDTLSDQVTEVGTIQCSRHTAHCHLQDFMVIANVLYALWDRQGQAMVEKTMLDLDSIRNDGFSVWETALCATETELTPAHLEEILMGKGSMTDKFFDAVMRPNLFSTLTLRIAIDQYTDACLSLPGSPPHPLTVTYASLEENIAAVVGCTVTLNRDPSTGALQYDKYWNALKRDWEGFIARCREIERSARWPLVLGAQGQGEIIVVERERVSALVAQDLPIHLHQVLSHDLRIADSQYDLFGILWTLRQKVGPQTMLSLENCLVDLMHQEIAFPFADILKDQASQFHFKDNLDEGANIWLLGRLASVDNLDDAVRTSLDVIGGLDMGVKREEEEEVELLLPPPVSDWFRGLTASYTATTTNARYDLCLCLMALLFFLVDDLSDWDPSLLAEVFAVFRGTATLRYIARQPSSATTQPPLDDVSSADDVVSLLQNMQVSRNRNHSTSTYSLVHRLLIQTGDLSHELPGAAHRFLDNTGLLQSITPAVASKAEVSFCEKLRVLGYMHVSRELLSWLPRAPGVSYVLSRIWLNAGRVDDAAFILEKLAGCFGPDNALSQEDRDTLQDVLPSSHLFDSSYPFYLYIATLFKSNSLQYHEVHFTKLALSVAPPMLDTSSLWHTIVRGYIDLGLFDEAYAAWISTPSHAQKREHISQLVYRMCESNQVDKLLSYNFAGFADEVEDALSFKARNEDPSMLPSYTRILYSWFLSRGDYRNAALTMYQKARKLRGLMTRDPSLVTRLAGEQLEAYLISMNALSLADPKNLWFLLPGSVDSTHENKHSTTSTVPESRYSHGKYENEIVQLTDIQYEYTLLSAQLDVMFRESPSSSEFFPPPSSIVLKLAQSNRFNTALATARSLEVDMTDLFAHLTNQCLRLSHSPDVIVQGDTSDWLLTDNALTWPGSPADKGWRYLRESIKRHDAIETDFKYSKIAFETILSFQSCPPPWLLQILEEHHHEYLIRISLRFGNLDQAVDHTLSLIRKTDKQPSRETSKNAASMWLPYTLIDQVLVNGMAQEPSPPRLSELRMEVINRVKRMQKLSPAH
ncbi:nucleoporin Nup120/160-domain-containing protein [Lentinula aciculospora]|uniref:Nucleoporin Nup120/160-domain-containing protein n=1 Tax=Lentinula aciculospora TaxID=153920 RepID=A0A9W9A2W2_9AGAR|nr:nucleoporin Nup120/160-domain-containing protein [Lentinula aciculospora]